MPRPKKVATAPAPSPSFAAPPNSYVASAARITNRRKDRPIGNGPQEWQLEAWHFFDSVGELAFCSQWQANAMSQVKLRLVHEEDDGSIIEVPDDTTDPMARLALDALDALFDGDNGQAQMMAAFGVHLSVPGEAYLVGLPPNESDGDMGRDQWRVVSNDELREVGSGKWELNRGDGVIEHLDTSTDENGVPKALIIRIWRSHPRKYVEATSPVRAALPVLRQIEGLSKHDASGIDSRLAGAGILLVPSEMTFQTPNVDGQPITDGQVDDFLAALAEAMMAAMQDQGSAAARVPIVVKAPGAFLSGVQHITFENTLDAAAEQKMEQNIRRLALSLDMPPEVLLGQADSNHWSAWLISEDAIKIHVQPLSELVTTAVTSRYVWPAMQGPSMVEDPAIKRYRLVPDTSALRQRTLDFGQTMALHSAFLISDETLLRESRFDVGDMPDDEEKKRRFTELVAQGAASADLVASAIDIVTGGAVTPMPSAVPAEQRGNISPEEQLPENPDQIPVPLPGPDVAPAPQEAPRVPPQPAGPTPPTAAALVACGTLAVERAVERAWNRAGKRGKDRQPVPTEMLDAALVGAWTSIPKVSATLGVDPGMFQAALDRYARGLLATGAAHDPAIFTRLIDEQVLAPPAAGAA